MSTENTKTVLSRKSIKAIADQVGQQLKQSSVQSDSGAAVVEAKQNGHGSKKLFFWGAASGLAVAVAAPLLGKQARPAVRGAIKGGLVAGRYFQRVASGVKEDIQDMAAEARTDLDVERPEPDSGRQSRQGKKGQPEG
jgi:hypothetical protein